MYCFQLFKTIYTREKPAFYLSLLEPAEPNDLHMTGIVGDALCYTDLKCPYIFWVLTVFLNERVERRFTGQNAIH